MISAIELPLSLQDQLHGEALHAYPRECCGLIEGFADGTVLRVVALHPMPNLAHEHDRFEVDPAAHITLLQNLRGTGRDIIGCYHSHPNGRAGPSERDRARADEDGFLWLITAIDLETRAASTAAFVCAAHDFSPVAIVHDVGGATDIL